VSCHRTYRITADDLKRLHSFAEDSIGERDCPRCGSDLCENCQANADLRQKLADAVSMSEAGCEITFTTYTGEAEEVTKGMVQ